MRDSVLRVHRVAHVQGHERHRPRVVRAGRRHARGDHVAVADRLDLFDPVALGQEVEVREQVVEDADHLGRTQPVRQRREVDDVGEQDRRGGELVGDGGAVGLELVGDRSRQDVQEQVLGLVLLDAQRGERLFALAHELPEQQEDDHPPDRHVQRDHRGLEPGRKDRPAAARQLAHKARGEEDPHEGGEPAQPRPGTTEHEGAERRQDAPQADRA